VRDYIHVSDLAEAHVLALQHLLSGGNSFATNLGTGQGASVRDVITAVEQCAGRKVRLVTCARRPGDPPTLVANPARAHEILKWKARYSALKTIVNTALQWHAHHASSVPHR